MKNVATLLSDPGLTDLKRLLARAGYTTSRVQQILKTRESADELLGNTARYSLFYLTKISRHDTPVSILAQLFVLSGSVSADKLNLLEPSLAQLIVKIGLVEAVADAPGLIRATVCITEYGGLYFLSDFLFENNGGDIAIQLEWSRCMPLHASSIELIHGVSDSQGKASFLDVGCGTGCQSLLAAADYGYVAGFDSNPRAVSFAQINSIVNGYADHHYFVEGWQSYVPEMRYEHVVFNTPDQDTAFLFINNGLIDLLALNGRADVWISCEVTEADSSLEQTIARRMQHLDRLDIEISARESSPFALSRQDVSEKKLPYDSLLVGHPTETAAYFRELEDRGVIEVASVIITIRHRAK
jgi:SAM-dependent methyltransferase